MIVTQNNSVHKRLPIITTKKSRLHINISHESEDINRTPDELLITDRFSPTGAPLAGLGIWYSGHGTSLRRPADEHNDKSRDAATH
jgi:hypothetical protein